MFGSIHGSYSEFMRFMLNKAPDCTPVYKPKRSTVIKNKIRKICRHDWVRIKEFENLCVCKKCCKVKEE